MKKRETTRCGFAVLVGLPNAGKSTLLNTLVRMPLVAVTPKPQTTQKAWRGIDTQGDCQIIWVDSPGLLQARNALHTTMHQQIRQAVRHADVLVHVVDVTRPSSRPDTADAPPMAEFAHKPVVSVFSKIDRLSAHVHRDDREGKQKVSDVPPTSASQNPQASKPPLWVSAVTGSGVEELRASVAGLLPQGPFLFDPQEVTDAPERALAEEFIRREAMLRLRQELPYCVAVTVEQFDERRRSDPQKPLVEIAAVLHVERSSQLPIVLGKGGECVKAIGTAARVALQQLLDCQVMLRLSVRVQPHWRAHASSLRKLGYGSS